MRTAARIVTLSLASLCFIAITPDSGRAQNVCSLFSCFFGHNCGSGCGGSCGSGCGSEPSCGCASGCGLDGRQYAGQAWSGCMEQGPRMCYCTDGCGNCASGGCGANSCGCGCGSEPTCATEPSCGCGSGSCNQGGSNNCCLFDCLFGCTGCNSEFYWCEWHNDPPRCQDPCDCHGNWIGPSTSYRAPYSHPYAASGSAMTPYYANQRAATQPTYAQQKPMVNRSQNVATRQMRPTGTNQVAKTYPSSRTTRVAPPLPPAQIARRPGATTMQTFQR